MTVKTALICNRIADMPIPHVRAFKGNCSTCGAAVWVAYSSPSANLRYCTHCIPADAAFDPADVTNAQMLDVIAAMKRPKQ